MLPNLTAPMGPLAPPDPMAEVATAHSQAKAQYDELSDISDMQEATRAELDKLVAMGDAVSLEDVMKGMAGLVGAGANPKALTAMMAGNPAQGQQPMPSGGQALAAWLQQQDQFVKGHEQAMAGAKAQAAHSTVASALQMLSAHHMVAKSGSGSSPGPLPSTSPNPLTSSGAPPNA